MKDYKETEENEVPSDVSSETDFPTSETQEYSTDMALSEDVKASNDAAFNYDQNESDTNDYNTDFPTSEAYQESTNESNEVTDIGWSNTDISYGNYEDGYAQYIDFEGSHVNDRHDPELSQEDLESRIASFDGLDYATKFNNYESIENSSNQFIEENSDEMAKHAQNAEAAISAGVEPELRYVKTINTGTDIGSGIDRNGEPIDNIQHVRGVYDYNPATGSFTEVTLYPDARTEIEERRKNRNG